VHVAKVSKSKFEFKFKLKFKFKFNYGKSSRQLNRMSCLQAALGPSGTEGGFRQAAAATLAALRDETDTLTVRPLCCDWFW